MNQFIVDKRQASATAEKEISKNVFLVAPGVWRMKDVFVNVYVLQNIEGTNWLLVDTGLKSSAPKIKKMVAEIFEPGSAPSAIIMTHGHFDHRGSLQQLADEWRVPVYAHHLEQPYLTGKASYPPADPTVGGGVMSTFSFTFPKCPINAEEHLQDLPENGTIPGTTEWKWIHTPGHAPGHVSLFRERDGVMIAGDAFVTTNQHSLFSVMTQKKELCGPPKYFTPDWGKAAVSVKELAALEPNVVATGHGPAMYGDEARKALHKLARQFWQLGMPAHGRYVKEPALFNDEGPTYIPSLHINYVKVAAISISAIALLLGIIFYGRTARFKKLFK